MTGKEHVKHGKLLIGTGALMVLAACLLTGWNLLQQSMAAQSSAATLAALMPDIEERKGEAVDISAQAISSVIPDPEGDVPDYILNPDMDMPAVTVDGDRYIGVLSIPDLDLELPVMENWNYPNLRKAPCRYTGSAYQNDLVICAHNYDSHFGRIRDLSIGSRAIFVDTDGNRFAYQVSEMEVLKPFACDEMKTGDWDLTLFTCTLGGATRVTVRCRLIE